MNASTKKRLSLFEQLSAVLTGFSLSDIEGTGMNATYLEVLDQKAMKDHVNSLLEAFGDLNLESHLLSVREHSMMSVILEDQYLGPLSQQIILMWYTGQWNFGKEDTYVISAQAYIESFSFRAAGSHPAGAKQPGFGTWQFPPNTFTEDGPH